MIRTAIFIFQALLVIKKSQQQDNLEKISTSPLASINETCPPGHYPFNDTYLNRGITCLPCSEESYKIDYGNKGCTFCPNGSKTNKSGATDASECMCSPGSFRQEVYQAEESMAVSCSKCPSGGACDGYRNEISPRRGYWLDRVPVGNNAFRFEILDCFGYQRCLGTRDNACAEGWGGNLCSLCAFDNGNQDSGKYFSFFGACKRCYSTVVNVLLHLAVYLSWILLNVFVAEQYTVISLAIDWMQLLSIIGYINTGWPESVSWFFYIARFFSFDLDVVSWQCISNWNFFWETLLQFSLPFALSLFWILLLCPVILYKFADRRHRLARSTIRRKSRMLEVVKDKLYKPGREFLGTIGFLEYFQEDINWNFLKAKVLVTFESTYVISTFYALSSLSYRVIGGKKVIFGAPYYEASTESLILGIIGLLFLSIGFPCLMFLKCMGFQPKDENDPGRFVESRVQQTYQWFYSRFRIGKWKLALCGFVHRFAQICAVVFIRDAGMALNVSFVLNLLFGLFIGLQHPNVSLRLNAIEYLTMLSTVATILCGMWFNWINVSRDHSINTSRALKSEFWGDIWLSDLVEICALVNLGLACLLFLYAALLEYIDIRCLSKSHAELKKLFKGRSSSNRRGLHWSHQGYLNSDELLVKYLHPIALRSWVDKIRVECIDEDKEKERLQLIADFGDTCYALSKFVEENPRHDPFSLSKDAVLWRKFLSHYPGILSMLLYGSEELKRSFIVFFKGFYSLYWDSSRRSVARFLSTFSGIFRFTQRFGCQKEPDDLEGSQGKNPFQDVYDSKIEEFFAQSNFEGLCLSCEGKCREIVDEHYPKILQILVDRPKSMESGSNTSSYALGTLRGMCKGVAACCTMHLCTEQDAVDFMKEEIEVIMKNFKRSNEFLTENLEPPSTWQACPLDISGLFTRRYRAPVSYWLASLSLSESKEYYEKYRKCRVERIRFLRLVNSLLNNDHKSTLEKFARLITLQSLSPFSSHAVSKKGKQLENVLSDFDIDSHSCVTDYGEFCGKPNRQPVDSAAEHD